MIARTKERKSRVWPNRLAGVGLVAVLALVIAITYGQFQGNFTAKSRLTTLSDRAGLLMNRGSKVTYNGVPVGQVADVFEVQHDGKPAAKLILEVDPNYVGLIPANVVAKIQATTVFGNKYVSLTAPPEPTPQRISSTDVIVTKSVTTEANTLFQTITQIAEQVNPVELNLTLSAAAEALSGLGAKFGQSIVNGNAILDEVNPQMPTIRHDIRQLTALSDVYANAAPNLFNFLDNAVTVARTLNTQRDRLDTALLAAIGFGKTAQDVVNRSKPFLERFLSDIVPTNQLLDTYSPEIKCTIRNYHGLADKLGAIEGGRNGYSMVVNLAVTGVENPYIYPDNLPRVNARGGPGGAPGCWQPITHDLWPAPYLVMDTGASIAPYTHFQLDHPILNEYVWGRQFGENTINP
ncbi:MCE family protein [Mycobacterium arosiense]|uniref:MCE family protein n=1 Tax=Mycobacterium arosiense TaxID=425468 RepID=UPI001FE87F2E